MKQKTFESAIIKRALKEAKEVRSCSDFEKFRLGAVIFSNKKILAKGCNTNKTDPEQFKYNQYRRVLPKNSRGCCHAEMSALRHLKKLGAKERGSDLGILVYRETGDGEPALARPCAACEKALRDYGISNIYYSGNHSMVYEKYM